MILRQQMLAQNIDTMSFTEIQSDVVTLRSGSNKRFGPAKEVFASMEISPCSIILENGTIENRQVSMQIQKDETGRWYNYEEGQMILSRKVVCRVASNGKGAQVNIKILHN